MCISWILQIRLLKLGGCKFMAYDRFMSKICAYYNYFENSKNKVAKLKSALNKLATDTLPKRDSESVFQVRDLINTSNLNISFTYKNTMCYYSNEENTLIIGVIGPSWRNMRSEISKDRFVSEQLDLILHLFSQYIYRSYQINLIGAIALATDTSSGFRGNTLKYIRGEYATKEIEVFKTFVGENNSELSSKIQGYLKLINALDPFVNQVIYYYAKYLELFDSNFIEEALTAADNMVDVIVQSIKKCQNAPTQGRKVMCNYVFNKIGLYDEAIKQSLESLYLLRCRFTAHPSKSKWWDFCEIYDNDIEQIRLSIRKLLILYLKFENKNRKIDAYPELWSQWFMKNCDIMYDSVWFHELF